jgi:carboxymethylenebutenolidase
MLKAKLFVVVLFLVSVALAPMLVSAQDNPTGDIDIMSGGKAYKSYLAAPEGAGPHPAVILIHSFNGLEQGYRDMTDKFAAEGFVVLALGWQTFEKNVPDDTVSQLIDDGIQYLSTRGDVDKERLGLTGFCAGGRYTMLFLPQKKDFKAGVAWYGFPYRGDTQPASQVGELESPMLIIHGTADEPSPISNIYKYAGDLTTANKYFELKVYAGKPHGFMISEGQLSSDPESMSAFREMVDFFTRKLGAAEKAS